MSKNHIPIMFNNPPKEIRKGQPIRFSREASTSDLQREIERQAKEILALQDKVNEFRGYLLETKVKTNDLVKTIERNQQGSTTQLITNINSGAVGGGSSATGSTDVRVQEVAVVSGVATTITFEQPSERLTVPEVWYDEGGERWRTGYAIDDTNLPVSFSITPQHDGYVTVSYKYL